MSDDKASRYTEIESEGSFLFVHINIDLKRSNTTYSYPY